MTNIEISQKFPQVSKIFSSLNFIVLGVIFVILLAIAFFLGSAVFDSYAQAKINEQKIEEMQKYIVDWKEKSEIVNKAKMHPVKPEDLDKVQTVLLTSIKQYGLNVTGFKTEKNPVAKNNNEQSEKSNSKDKDQQGKNKISANVHDYELNVEGSYSAVVNFLNSIHQNNLLISIRSWKMQQQKGVVKVDLKYRVYTK